MLDLFNPNRPYTPEEIRELADKHLSYFDKQQKSSKPMQLTAEQLVGTANPLLTFPPQGNFGNELGNGVKQVTLQITNNDAAATRQIVLFAGPNMGDYANEPIQLDDTNTIPVLLPGEALADYQGAGASIAKRFGVDRNGVKSVREFLQYVKHNPTRLLGIKITSTTAQQLGKFITVEEINVYENAMSRTIRPLNTQSSSSFQNTVAEIVANEIVSTNRRFTYELMPSAQVTIDLFFGAEINTTNALVRFAETFKVMARSGNNAAEMQDAIIKQEQAMAFSGNRPLLG
jgi:hypothetical protein